MKCQVSSCTAVLNDLKEYYRRYRICTYHWGLHSLTIDGEERRFCQQCGKFQPLSDFDEKRRTCRAKLEVHNRRRRKHEVAQRAAAKAKAEESRKKALEAASASAPAPAAELGAPTSAAATSEEVVRVDALEVAPTPPGARPHPPPSAGSRAQPHPAPTAGTSEVSSTGPDASSSWVGEPLALESRAAGLLGSSQGTASTTLAGGVLPSRSSAAVASASPGASEGALPAGGARGAARVGAARQGVGGAAPLRVGPSHVAASGSSSHGPPGKPDSPGSKRSLDEGAGAATSAAPSRGADARGAGGKRTCSSAGARPAGQASRSLFAASPPRVVRGYVLGFDGPGGCLTRSAPPIAPLSFASMHGLTGEFGVGDARAPGAAGPPASPLFAANSPASPFLASSFPPREAPGGSGEPYAGIGAIPAASRLAAAGDSYSSHLRGSESADFDAQLEDLISWRASFCSGRSPSRAGGGCADGAPAPAYPGGDGPRGALTAAPGGAGAGGPAFSPRADASGPAFSPRADASGPAFSPRADASGPAFSPRADASGPAFSPRADASGPAFSPRADASVGASGLEAHAWISKLPRSLSVPEPPVGGRAPSLNFDVSQPPAFRGPGGSGLGAPPAWPGSFDGRPRGRYEPRFVPTQPHYDAPFHRGSLTPPELGDLAPQPPYGVPAPHGLPGPSLPLAARPPLGYGAGGSAGIPSRPVDGTTAFEADGRRSYPARHWYHHPVHDVAAYPPHSLRPPPSPYRHAQRYSSGAGGHHPPAPPSGSQRLPTARLTRGGSPTSWLEAAGPPRSEEGDASASAREPAGSTEGRSGSPAPIAWPGSRARPPGSAVVATPVSLPASPVVPAASPWRRPGAPGGEPRPDIGGADVLLDPRGTETADRPAPWASLTLYGATPGELPGDLRESISRAAGWDPETVVGHLRRGCVHVHVRGEGVEAARGSGSDLGSPCALPGATASDRGEAAAQPSPGAATAALSGAATAAGSASASERRAAVRGHRSRDRSPLPHPSVARLRDLIPAFPRTSEMAPGERRLGDPRRAAPAAGVARALSSGPGPSGLVAVAQLGSAAAVARDGRLLLSLRDGAAPPAPEVSPGRVVVASEPGEAAPCLLLLGPALGPGASLVARSASGEHLTLEVEWVRSCEASVCLPSALPGSVEISILRGALCSHPAVIAVVRGGEEGRELSRLLAGAEAAASGDARGEAALDAARALAAFAALDARCPAHVVAAAALPFLADRPAPALPAALLAATIDPALRACAEAAAGRPGTKLAAVAAACAAAGLPALLRASLTHGPASPASVEGALRDAVPGGLASLAPPDARDAVAAALKGSDFEAASPNSPSPGPAAAPPAEDARGIDGAGRRRLPLAPPRPTPLPTPSAAARYDLAPDLSSASSEDYGTVASDDLSASLGAPSVLDSFAQTIGPHLPSSSPPHGLLGPEPATCWEVDGSWLLAGGC